MSKESFQESSNTDTNSSLNKTPLPNAHSAQSVLSVDTEEHEGSLNSSEQITKPERQPSNESTRSSVDDLPTTFHSSPRTSMANIIYRLSAHKLTYNKEAQKLLIKDFEEQLHNNLRCLLDQKNDIEFTAELYYELGSVYQKLAKVDDLLSRQEHQFKYNLLHALKYFGKAITHTDKTSQNYNDLAKYHSYQAKCFYTLNQHDDARKECLDALAYNAQDYTAHEIMGYIHKSEGHYNLALASFKKSAADKKNVHYVVSLYNQSTALAALGKQEESLCKLKIANSISLSSNLEIEDKILAGEMLNPEYQTLIRELASLSSKQATLGTPRNQSIQAMVNEIHPGSSSPSKIDSYSQKLSSMAQELKAERTEHLNNKEKLEAELEKLKSGTDISEIAKDTIKSDPDLEAFYTELKRHLNATYKTTQSIGTGLVENGKTGHAGEAAKAIGFLEGLIPIPKAFTIPVKLTSLALETLDKNTQEECIENFNAIAEDEDTMKDLSKAIALKLTLQRKETLTQSEEKSHTNLKDIKKLAKADAENAAKFIEGIIFDGRINKDDITTLDQKVNMILALWNIDQDHSDGNIKELPESVKATAQKTLEKMKNLPHHWHNNTDLENAFVNKLADNIHKAKVPEEVLTLEKFSHSLAHNLFNNQDITTTTHRNVKFWERKYLLKESFLSENDYFIKIIFDLSRYFNDYQMPDIADFIDTPKDNALVSDDSHYSSITTLGDSLEFSCSPDTI